MEIPKEYWQLEILKSYINTSEKNMIESKRLKNIYMASTALLGVGTYFAGAGSEGLVDFMYGFAPITGIGTLFSTVGAYNQKKKESKNDSKLQKLKHEYDERIERYKERLKEKGEELEEKVTESLKPRTKSLTSKSREP